jgi:hypothetical protein
MSTTARAGVPAVRALAREAGDAWSMNIRPATSGIIESSTIHRTYDFS